MAPHRRLAALASQLSRAPAAAVVPPPAEIDAMYASTFSRTVWRLYGGAKGLAMWY
jgi:hypothetical protein